MKSLATPAREALLRERYAQGDDFADLIGPLNALPGAKFTALNQIRTLVARLRICRDKGKARNVNANPAKFTPERAEILRRDYPAGVASMAIMERVNVARLGPEMTTRDVTNFAARLGLARPDGFRPATANAELMRERNPAPAIEEAPRSGRRLGRFNEAMDKRLLALWADGYSEKEIAGILAAEFKAEIVKNHVVGRRHCLQRIGHPDYKTRERKQTTQRKQRLLVKAAEQDKRDKARAAQRIAARVKRHEVVQAATADAAPEAIAKAAPARPYAPAWGFGYKRPYVEPLRPAGIPATAGCDVKALLMQTPEQRRRKAEDQMIADFIARRGVSRCPAAMAEFSTAEISVADREAVRAYQKRKDEEYEAVNKSRHDKVMQNRRAKLSAAVAGAGA